jgi:uncharacterized protein (DUF1015 family)
MSLLEPFAAVRYAKTKDLSPLLSPPYDIIGPELAARLRAEARNAIHVELPEGEYTAAAELWSRWLREGALARDPEPAFYLCEQTFDRGGKKKRLGLFGALRLEAPGGAVMPHENTFAKPREERMRLLKALKINTSPVFGTFQDAAGVLAAAAEPLGAPDAQGTDPQGSACRLWKIADRGLVDRLSRAVDASKVLIADGHHRYRVAYEFGEQAKLPGSDRVLACLVADDDPGLVVLPTHRLAPESVVSLEDVTALCDVWKKKDLEELEAALGGLSFGFISMGGRTIYLCKPRPAALQRNGAPVLDVEWVQRMLLKNAGHDEGVEYLHEAGELLSKVRSTRGTTGVVLGPLTVPAIREAVEKNGLLPQKSTYFYPKIATGLVFRTLG